MRRFALICALVLSSLIATTGEARAQETAITVSILRRTAVRTAPSASAPTIAFLNPSTFEVTQVRVSNGFVRLLLNQIDRRRSANGYGFIAAVDVAVDSATTTTARAGTDTAARPRVRPAAAVHAQFVVEAPCRSDPS